MKKTLMIAMALAALAPQAGPLFAQHEHHQQQAAAPVPDKLEAQPVSGLDIPDVPVVDQDGNPLHFYSDLVKGKVVAINFVFTNCTTICPPMGASFAKLQKILGERAGKEAHLISVSVDPVTDTPERMKAWGQKFGAGPGWTLVTGDRNEITRLLKALGVYTPDINDHSPLVLVGNDPKGQWTRAYALAPPAKVAELIDGVAAPAEAAHAHHH